MLKLIKNANVFNPDPLGLCHILLAGEKIVYIGSDLPDLDSRLGVEILDVTGESVIPGLIDAHAHITGGGGETGPASRVPPVFLSEFTLAGVTSVVGVLGTDDLTRNTQTLVTQAYGLREEGLSAWCHTGGYHLPLTTLTGSTRGDIVFIDPIIGVGELAVSDHRSSQPTLDEFLRVASDAYVAGLMTGKAGIVHCHMGDGERGLTLLRAALDKSEIPARVFNPTHVNRNLPLFCEAKDLTRRGCYIDLTAFPEGHSEPGISAADAFLEYRAGGFPADRLTISSDGGGCLPAFDAEGRLTRFGVGLSGTLPDTLKELVHQNITLDEALPPLTSNVANLLKLKHKGRLKVGMDADLVVLDAETKVRDVMARGRWHVRDGTAVVLGTYESN
ncbi:beta-aspartyl-peptidase [Pseudohalocynthiibacter sp. F2068]|jgi:beta-aspartyl-dipeptidase (metallo-type)|uniref:beta-aspartyl-peptidase n=1 Tax=Pseudohalocynthiibacter sp. F2068 TaxID=2926418 RepID=UPI001FF1105E|nr:beta-aspartyl-peptidase [Pseudohalocynthiibacter sp. F2068]MCK0103839.1 beta-aspartyl-peptidase [Pseudohalocynthiibacter sp. F2068]